MSNPRHSDPDRPNRRARAPYNFVPLPEKVARADQDLASLPTHDRYHAGRLTGQIECRLVTQSPLYTRRAVSPQWWARWTEQMDRLHLDDEAKRYYAEFFQVEADKPLIPGSSLRGMVRSVLEIIAHGHVRWVADQPAFTFRAVAAARTDPLSQPYDEIIGRFTRNVRAGYLNYDARRDAWSIQPALTPADLRLGGEQSSFLRVKEDDIERNAVRGFRRLNNPNYRPGFYPVRFNVEPMSRGVRVVQLRSYDERDTARKYAGVLVCSGNMKETTDDKPSPRKRHALILAPNRNQQPIPIEPEVIRAYKASLTDFQREQLTDWNEDGSFGCLGDGKPVFFVTEAKRDGRGQRQEYVRWFGHTPNFRVPARLQVSGQERASTPLDFVPTALRTGDEPDLVEAIFGWVEDGITSLKGQRAGRVSFSDARFVAAQNGLWLQESPVALHTLSSPKPTTFQHYLVQDREHQHNPDQLSSLAHYGTSPTETQIRGYKRYWHKGPTPDLAATDKERQHSDQLTYVRPLKPGVEFNFTIRFENLSDVELGALLWALALPGEAGRHYYHKLGMGKPLGMGAVALTPTLTVDDRTARYRQLLAGDQWHQPSEQTPIQPYLDIFEAHLRKQLGFQGPLAQQDRIKTLLTLLEWRGSDPRWLDQTRYLEIERGVDKVNEYKERPVLPNVQAVADSVRDRSGPATVGGSAPNPIPASTSDLETGTLKRFGVGRRADAGFIQPDASGDDLYFNYSRLRADPKLLRKGLRVQFRRGPGRNGDEAYDVSLIT